LRLKRVYGDGELLYRPVINTLKGGGGRKNKEKIEKNEKNDKKNDKKKTNTAYG